MEAFQILPVAHLAAIFQNGRYLIVIVGETGTERTSYWKDIWH